jgi:hypothetical protein
VGRTGVVVLESRVGLSTPKALQPRDGFLEWHGTLNIHSERDREQFHYKVAGNLLPELAKV